MECKFNVSMNAEAKKDGEVTEVILDVSFEGVSEDDIRKHAMANMKVHWQAQIRNNWDKFIEDGVPETVIFGVPLYESAGRKPLTPESAIALLKGTGMSQEDILALINKS